MDGISIWQLLTIAVVVVLLSGTKKLGSIDSDLGASIKDFKKAMSDDEPKQDKTSQDVDFIAKITADKQADTNQEWVKTEDAKHHDKGQVQSVFDIGFSELPLVFIIGLVALEPQRLLVTVKTVAGWIRTLHSLAATVQNELIQELKLQGLQNSLKKVEKASLTNLTLKLKASIDELCQTAEPMKRSHVANDPEKASDEARTIHNLVVKGNEIVHEGMMPAAAQTQVSLPEQKPEATPEPVVKPITDAKPKTAVPSPSSSDKP